MPIKLQRQLSSRVLHIVVVLTICLTVLVFPSYGQTETGNGWSEPQLISYGWFPDIFADRAGRVHLVWSYGIRDYDSVMYTTSEDGENWAEINDIAARPSLGAVTRPALMVDDEGTFHMTYKDYAIYYTHGPADSVSAVSLLPSQQLSRESAAYFSRIARDSKGVMHLIFTENIIAPGCPLCLQVFYRQSTDNGVTWSPIVNISSALPTGSAKPQVLIDDKDNIHVVWESGRGGDLGQLLGEASKVAYAVSYDGGQTWEKPYIFTAPNTFTSRNIAIGLDGDGKLVTVWLSLPKDVIYYHVSADRGRTWSDPQPLTGVWSRAAIHNTKLDDFSAATDSAGRLHLVLVGRTVEKNPKAMDVLHLTWDGTAWSTPEVIANYPVVGSDNFGNTVGDFPEWPRISIGNGNQLHVTWFVRDAGNLFGDTASYQIIYSHRTIDAPPLSIVIWPTATPTLVPTQPAVSEATETFATAVPTLSPDIPDPTVTETNILRLVARTTLPSAAIVLVITAIFLLIRRR